MPAPRPSTPVFGGAGRGVCFFTLGISVFSVSGIEQDPHDATQHMRGLFVPATTASRTSLASAFDRAVKSKTLNAAVFERILPKRRHNFVSLPCPLKAVSPLRKMQVMLDFIGERGGTRTLDPMIKSHLFQTIWDFQARNVVKEVPMLLGKSIPRCSSASQGV